MGHRKLVKIPGLSIVFLFFIYNFTYNQNTQSLSLEFSLLPVQKLFIENTKSFPPINASDYEANNIGINDAVTLSVSSNVPWKVVIFTNQMNLYKSFGKYKPVQKFQWRSGAKSFQSISNKPEVVLQGEAGVKDLKIKLDYRLKLDWKNTPPGMWGFRPEFKIERNYVQFITPKSKMESKTKNPPKKSSEFKKSPK
ncbi:MAG: hypothetical protein H8E71_00800 [Candidatus Marinimicrobia bacterium]|nr:hypothetical protein [Candidatus Neomarinimicrobiota bacterium]